MTRARARAARLRVPRGEAGGERAACRRRGAPSWSVFAYTLGCAALSSRHWCAMTAAAADRRPTCLRPSFHNVHHLPACMSRDSAGRWGTLQHAAGLARLLRVAAPLDSPPTPTRSPPWPPSIPPTCSSEGLYHCDYCHKDLSSTLRIKCAACKDFDLCLECFRCGRG